MIEHDVCCIDGITACCAIGRAEGGHEHQLPVIVIAAREDPVAGAAAGSPTSQSDPPPLKWSDLRYVFDIKEDCNGKEAIQA